MRGQPGFWDLGERYEERLSAVGDPLEKLNGIIPWPVFEKPLAKALKRSDGAKGGRPPFPAVLMFKILVLQALYNLSDDQAEFVIQDRLSFMRFLGLSLSEKVPDAKTIWLFRESLVRAGAPSTICSLVSTSTSHAPATWPGAVRLSMPPSSRRPSSTTAWMRKRRSRPARSLRTGKTNPPSSRRRTGMRVGR